MAGQSILLIDDDTELCALMADFFQAHGIQLELAHDGSVGLSRAVNERFDLVILDVMLPHMDGFQVLEFLRRRSAVPVIMLTARADERDRIGGLDRGADDYLSKPFQPGELLARIRAVLRRSGRVPVAAAPLECGQLRLNPATREVALRNRIVPLTGIEFDILHQLMRSAGRIVSRDEISAALHQREATPYERALDVHISHLRKKLESERPVIQTVRGVGYLLSPATGEH